MYQIAITFALVTGAIAFAGTRIGRAFTPSIARPFALPFAYLGLQFSVFPLVSLITGVKRRDIPHDEYYIYGLILATTFTALFYMLALNAKPLHVLSSKRNMRGGFFIFAISTLLLLAGFGSAHQIVSNAGGLISYIEKSGYYRSGGLVGSGALVFAILYIMPLGPLIWLTFGGFRGRGFSKIIFLGYTIAAIAIMAVIGYRSGLFFFLLEILIIFCMRGKIGKKSIAISVSVIVAAMIGVNALRDASNQLLSLRETVMFNLVDNLTRFNASEVVAVVMEKTDSVAKLELGAFNVSLIFTSYIPRSVFPDKPIPYSVYFSQTIMHEYFPNIEVASGVAPSIVGDAVWNFGWLGVVIYAIAAYPLFSVVKGFYSDGINGQLASQLYYAKSVTFMFFLMESPVIAINALIPTVVILGGIHSILRVSSSSPR
jgi:oligosaccharide repeat unit polymerase